ncbi:hypothetical protein F1188_12450 [Roseospira marina]|uniref:CdiI immunity protein domain-containing protein n=1 Tax=Roseospira marina TaxID=140057 RepID=A0A5M6IA16_9PROT|nr:contact-dependent growth inhibition system immunity protein [Roseospira marina]KAA5605090.1 hypothetical protein F1188_12450 [Roseospira marina]MBB4314837.1 hypothetical protein [Roseospira marina]MBB5087837.1 hypothetical protein [Roseospira marina]
MAAFPHLDQLFGGYLHQDFDAVHGSFEEAVADFARTDPSRVEPLRQEMTRFLAHYGADADAEYTRRYGGDIALAAPDETAAALFGEIDALLVAAR